MDLFTIAWISWIVGFLVIEFWAIFRQDEGDTLSEHLRKWFNVKTNHGRTVWLVVSFIFFVVWFIPHIAFGWNFGL